jgi:ribose/xylose/arabinose/galactoside ABC-type transport system permease subunit
MSTPSDPPQDAPARPEPPEDGVPADQASLEGTAPQPAPQPAPAGQWSPQPDGTAWPPAPFGAPGQGAYPTPPGTRPDPASTLAGSAITLSLGAVVALVFLATGDGPPDYFRMESVQIVLLAVAMLAAALAHLVSRDEYDLSIFGVAAMGSYIYAEVDSDSALAGLVPALVVGALLGAAIGLVRWLTQAHSALISLGAGSLIAAIAVRWGPGPVGTQVAVGNLDDPGLAVLALVGVAGAAAGLAVVHTSRPAGRAGTPGTADAPSRPGPDVILGFALTGLAAALYGAFLTGAQGYHVGVAGTWVLLLPFAGVAIGGVVRGSGPWAPLVAGAGGIIAMLVRDAARFNDWRRGEEEIALGVLFLVCVIVAHGVRRLTTSASRVGPAAPVGTAPTGHVPMQRPPSGVTTAPPPGPPGPPDPSSPPGQPGPF